MKNYFWISICAAAGLLGCGKDETLPSDAELRPVAVEIAVCADRMSSRTRATDEEAIRDLNFYLYDMSGAVVLHSYQTAPTLHFECLPGVYRLRLVANLGEDLGTGTDLDACTIDYTDAYDALPMTYDDEIEIPVSAGGAVTLPAIEVKRRVAKISCNIAVKSADIELRSVRLCSIPKSARLFSGDDTPPNRPADYTNSEETTLSGHQTTETYYMLPNGQGTIASIRDQRQKNAANAPGNASYLLIRATRGNRVLAYSIYLGENNTSDFNVRANAHYTLNISILGNNEVDTRVSSYTLSVYDDFEENSYGGYCIYDAFRKLYVNVWGGNRPSALSGHLKITAGDADKLDFNSGEYGPEHDLDLCDGENDFRMNYPVGYTTANSRLSYSVTLTDEYGFTQQYDFEHRMANAVYVHENAGGSVVVNKSLYSETEAEGSGRRTLALCLEEGCRFTATAVKNNTFVGWYADAGYTHALSTDASRTYLPDGSIRHLFARFQPTDIPLDKQGTANCYIAPKLDRRYSFCATVMGNGKATVNIVPRPLTGTKAKVIWETGALQGEVINSVEYRAGRIYFVTGSRRGNAVIGLFNASNVCIWSWHIWVDDYTPEKEYDRYYSGAVFMDRNLGAIENYINHTFSKGMYYQWGRKDPFVGPASNDEYTASREPAAYLEGYEYSTIFPNFYEPEDIMSIGWATAHPTTFIKEALYQDGDIREDIWDWLFTPHPNLWGNRTTATVGTAINQMTEKSIYDPCPPGWRVPDIEDFKNVRIFTYSKPAYSNIFYNDSQTTKYPLSGSFDGVSFSYNGTRACVYTCSPYIWSNGALRCSRLDCSTIHFSDRIGSWSYFRFSANPVRCVKE